MSGIVWGTGRAATLNYGETPLGWHFFEYQRQVLSSCIFFPAVLAPRQRSHLWSCFTVHSSVKFFSRGKIAPGTSSFFSFTFSCFVLLISPSVLLFWAVWTPLKHFTWLSAMFVYIRVPKNNPIMKRARLVWVPGYHSFPKWATDTSQPSRDSYRSFKSQPRCQNPRSESLCCKSIFTLNLPLNNA